MGKMGRILKTIASSILLASISLNAWAIGANGANGTFVIKNIRVVGLHGLSKQTVLNYMPVKAGDTYTDAKSNAIINALFQSGFFTNVWLQQSGQTLVVNVQERATIATVRVNGNSAITKDQMKQVLQRSQLTVGSIYDRSRLKMLRQGLQQQYFIMGYFSAKVTTQVDQLKRNRVAITITIKEGKVAKVKNIQFVGNKRISSSRLLGQMSLTTPRPWTFLTKTDQYARQKLDQDLQTITAYYLDHGFVHFKIVSKQVSLSPDRQSVYITITVNEGEQYHFASHRFSGSTLLSEEQLNKLVVFEDGAIFSRSKVQQTIKAITFALGDKGYAFAKVVPIPTINESNKTVSLNFHITLGSRVYVRHINYVGNTVTADYVLRRATQQMEGALLSTRKMRQTEQQLRVSGFFKSVEMKTVPVPGTNNQVDLVYTVKEGQPGRASANVNYGTLGWGVGAGINQPNFLGTGKTVGVNFSKSRYATSYSISYFNPYTTLNNIGKGISVFYSKTDPGNLNLAGTYTFDTYGFNVNYSIPLNLYTRLTTGYSLSHIALNLFQCSDKDFKDNKCMRNSAEILDFVKRNHNRTRYNQVNVNAGISYAKLDRGIFPTKGVALSAGAQIALPVFKSSLENYKVGAAATWLQPIDKQHKFVIRLKGGVGYGNGYGKQIALPFFLNYYAGGLAQGLVRGYETNTLGPLDSNGKPLGGNFLIHGSASLIFPNFVSPDTLRTSVFVDAGNVYQTVSRIVAQGKNQGQKLGRDAGPVRFSAGLAAQWRSPVGPLVFSFGFPINKQKGDTTEQFQFNMGTSF